jgi:hypothetical protein
MIQELLGLRPRTSSASTVTKRPPDWARLNSREAYLGNEGTDSFASPGVVTLGESRLRRS